MYWAFSESVARTSIYNHVRASHNAYRPPLSRWRWANAGGGGATVQYMPKILLQKPVIDMLQVIDAMAATAHVIWSHNLPNA